MTPLPTVSGTAELRSPVLARAAYLFFGFCGASFSYMFLFCKVTYLAINCLFFCSFCFCFVKRIVVLRSAVRDPRFREDKV